MALSILARSMSADEAALLLLISLGTGFDQIGTALLVKVLRQTLQAQACSSTSITMKKQKYFNSSF